jgi:LmbE family N-acetylglucosaminyl deacetylase
MSKKTYAKNNIIIIAPHPDDETLGCGGTILKHKAKGDNVACIFVTNIFENQGFSSEKVQERQNEIEKVSKAYNFDKVFKLNYSTTSLDSNSLLKLIPDISKIFNEFMPTVVYLPNYSDVHSDHKIVFDAAYSCTKSFRYPFIKKILMYETISETEFAPSLARNIFNPNYYVNISNYLNKKIEIMKIYSSELGSHPFPRSEKNIKALAIYRGASSGYDKAEAFQLLKYIDE